MDEIIKVLGDSPLAGALAIGSGSLQAALSIASQVLGRRRVASAASGAYWAAPEALVVGEGLEQIPSALDQLRKGVSATKLAVRI